jgi:two-component system, NtrC family, nitrogen regulation sensor histidine kinase NtrY
VKPAAPRRGLSHENRIFLTVLISALPAVLVAMVLLWIGDHSAKARWTFLIVVVLFWIGGALAARERVIRPLFTLANLLAALREGDFSVRGRGARSDDALGQAMEEVNALASTLREQRLSALEATALLRRVMEEIDVAVFAFDASRRLRLVNKAGETLLGRPAPRLLGSDAAELGLVSCLENGDGGVVDMSFPGGTGRWEVRRGEFRMGGLPHQLLVFSEVSRVLRQEERQAWRRLIRVIGHELNNSLAPLKSIAGSLEDLLHREPPPEDWKEDMEKGLAVIAARTEALNRFMSAYAGLARLPSPKFQEVDLPALIARVAGLETRVPVTVEPGNPVTIQADPDQMEQLLINLLRNAADASLETGGKVMLDWRVSDTSVEIRVADEGPGLSATGNLFVPFFTTKPGGTGIGLVICREIAEAHHGSVTLENRKDGRGCVARLVVRRDKW